jgi:hypothetical protein
MGGGIMSNDQDFSGLTFVDEAERLHFARARLGHETLTFLRSNVGKYLHGRAKQDLEESMQGMSNCNVDSIFGRRKYKKYQKKADLARNFISYCTDIITEGEFSERELDEYRG